jgi:short-subunit dehydrogenase involved in D-alanine esterification of teichoic acids
MQVGDKVSKQTAVEWLEKEFNKLEATVGVYGIMYSLIDQAKEMENQQLEKELNAFFLYFRNNGEHFIGIPIEQFVKKYLKSR